MIKRVAKILVLMLAVLLALTGCSGTKGSGSGSTSASSGGTLKFGLSAEPSSLDPAKAAQTAAREVKLCIYRGLYNYYTDGKPTPELASSYTVSSDGLTYTFKLRDAKFQNGDTVKAEDVKFSFDRQMDSSTGAQDQKLLSNMIDKIEVVDDKDVKFTLKKANAAFINYIALPEMAIVSKSWTTSHNGDLNSNPMGAGPYAFVSWSKGQEIVLKKSSNYYESDKPHLDGIKFTFLADDNTRVNALQSNDVDIIEYVPYQSASTIKSNSNFSLISSNGPFAELQFNLNVKPFDDVRVRQAFAYAINRQNVIDTAFNGQGQPIYGTVFHKGAMGYDSKLENTYTYNIQKAKDLLTQAGYPNGFTFTLTSNSTYAYHQQTAVAVQSELKKIGVTANLQLPDWATRMSLFNAGNFSCMVDCTEGDIGTDPEWFRQFVGNGGGNNKGNFNDDQVNSLLDQGVATTDTAKRGTIYQQLNQRIVDQVPYLYLCYKAQMWATTTKVKGFKALLGVEYQSGITLEDTYLTK